MASQVRKKSAKKQTPKSKKNQTSPSFTGEIIALILTVLIVIGMFSLGFIGQKIAQTYQFLFGMFYVPFMLFTIAMTWLFARHKQHVRLTKTAWGIIFVFI
ncbi:MAG: hypothetical protein ACRCV7_01115, partial [Culicoidibacterales bacterium]